MIVLIQKSMRFLPEIPGLPTVVSALRELIIGVMLVLFLQFQPQELLLILLFRLQGMLPGRR
jgi:hypothetical protein